MKNQEMPMVRIYQEDGTYIDRKMNAEEIAQAEIDTANLQTRKAEAEAKEAAKLAILDRIGLTADELKTILG